MTMTMGPKSELNENNKHNANNDLRKNSYSSLVVNQKKYSHFLSNDSKNLKINHSDDKSNLIISDYSLSDIVRVHGKDNAPMKKRKKRREVKLSHYVNADKGTKCHELISTKDANSNGVSATNDANKSTKCDDKNFNRQSNGFVSSKASVSNTFDTYYSTIYSRELSKSLTQQNVTNHNHSNIVNYSQSSIYPICHPTIQETANNTSPFPKKSFAEDTAISQETYRHSEEFLPKSKEESLSRNSCSDSNHVQRSGIPKAYQKKISEQLNPNLSSEQFNTYTITSSPGTSIMKTPSEFESSCSSNNTNAMSKSRQKLASIHCQTDPVEGLNSSHLHVSFQVPESLVPNDAPGCKSRPSSVSVCHTTRASSNQGTFATPTLLASPTSEQKYFSGYGSAHPAAANSNSKGNDVGKSCKPVSDALENWPPVSSVVCSTNNLAAIGYCSKPQSLSNTYSTNGVSGNCSKALEATSTLCVDSYYADGTQSNNIPSNLHSNFDNDGRESEHLPGMSVRLIRSAPVDPMELDCLTSRHMNGLRKHNDIITKSVSDIVPSTASAKGLQDKNLNALSKPQHHQQLNSRKHQLAKAIPNANIQSKRQSVFPLRSEANHFPFGQSQQDGNDHPALESCSPSLPHQSLVANKLNKATAKKLNSGCSLSVPELRGMASRQQQQIEAQQQLLVAREQRLKFLKQQQQGTGGVMPGAADHERLRRMRDRVEAQEAKLRRLRALRGQADNSLHSTASLTSDLDAMRQLFSQKEQEMVVAVSRVDELTQQLESLRNNSHLNCNMGNANELEKLRRELLYRNSVNRESKGRVNSQRELLTVKTQELSRLDRRIAELQTRLHRKKMLNHQLAQQITKATQAKQAQLRALQEKNTNVPEKEQIEGSKGGVAETTDDGVIKQSLTSEELSEFGGGKQDPKYQTLPYNTKLCHKYPNGEMEGDENESLPPPPPAGMVAQISQSFEQQNNQLKISDFINYSSPNDGNSTNSNLSVSSSSSSGVMHTVHSMPMSRPARGLAHGLASGNAGANSSASDVTSSNSLVNNTSSITTNKHTSISSHTRPMSLSQQYQIQKQQQEQQQQQYPANVYSTSNDNNNQQAVVKPAIPAKPLVDSGDNQASPLSSQPLSQPLSSSRLKEDSLSTTEDGRPNGIEATHGHSEVSAISSGSQSSSANIKNISSISTKPTVSKLPVSNSRNSSSKSESLTPSTSSLTPTLSSTSLITNTISNLKKHEETPSPMVENTEQEPKETSSYHTGDRRIEMPPSFLFPENESPPSDLMASQNGTKMEDHDDRYLKENKEEKFQDQRNRHTDKDETDRAATLNTASAEFLPDVVSRDPQSSAVIRRKGNLKSSGSLRLPRRVSFDPLALLLDAALEGELELVKRTVMEVPNPSAANDEGITALHNAICAGHLDIVTFLVTFGCDVNAQDSDGWTPLHCAASCNNLGMVRFLVEHGACILATTGSDHETPAEKCEQDEEGYDGCSQYLYSIQEKLGILNGGLVYAVYDYYGEEHDEISFRCGDAITVLRRGDENEKDWWWGQLHSATGNTTTDQTTQQGYLPRNLLGLYPRMKIPPFGVDTTTVRSEKPSSAD